MTFKGPARARKMQLEQRPACTGASLTERVESRFIAHLLQSQGGSKPHSRLPVEKRVDQRFTCGPLKRRVV